MEASYGPDDVVYLRMKSAEALVLFEWVHRHEDSDIDLQALVEDPAERMVLWSISGALESLLAEPFRSDYLDLLEDARATLRPAEE